MSDGTGNILKQKRIELGFDIAEVSRRTRIREDFIAAIENDDPENVPSSYYKLFIKKYSDFLSVDLPEEVQETAESDHIYEMLRGSDSGDGRKNRNHFMSGLKKVLLFGYMHRKLFIFAGFVLLIFLFVRHIYSILDTGTKTEQSESLVRIITIEGEPDERISVNIRDSIIIEDDRTDFFTLKISAADSCYICFFKDTMQVRETIILPGRQIEFRVENIFEAKLGKSGAVSIDFNQNRVLEELRGLKNSSSFIRATHSGTERIRRSDRINRYLWETYGLE